MRYGDYHAGNRRHAADRDFDWGATAQAEGFRGPTALEIALVRKLGSKVRLNSEDFARIEQFSVHRTEDKVTGDVILEVRDKNDARGKLVDLVRQPNGSYAVDQYAGL